MMIPKQIVFFSGFAQDGDRCLDGIERAHYDTLCNHGSRDCCITIHPWHTPIQSLSRQIIRMGTSKAMLVGFSLGAGRSVIDLCRALNGVVTITHAVLCDPVPAQATILLSFIGGAYAIKLPGNIGKIWTMRQDAKRPFGAALKSTSKNTVIVTEKVMHDVPHRSMDDIQLFHDMVAEAANDFSATA
jgi:hypothetical protein